MRRAGTKTLERKAALRVEPEVAASTGDIPHFLVQIRQQYLEALPIAAAVVHIKDGAPIIAASNSGFATLAQGDRFAPDVSATPQAVIDRCNFLAELTEFLTNDCPSRELEWDDGGAVAGRHFAVRLARIMSLGVQEPRCLLTLIDRTAEVQAEKSLRLEMFNDSLTGLPNRAGFTEQVEQALAGGATDAQYAMLMIDLNRFSRINESIGSLSGDELLITVARRLMSALRAGDVIARTGGDEFGILMRLIDGPGDALHVAQRITELMAQPVRLSDLEICIDCAIGCVMSEGESDVEELIRRANFAVKSAKSTGKIEVYQPVAFNMARRRFSLETDLRHAIENEQLKLAFQPLIDLSSGAVAGFEALARWTDPDRGVIQPTDFIPVAEESGLIVPLGRWALDAAAQTLAGWDRKAGKQLPIYVAVNLSAIQLARDDIASTVERTLSSAGLEGKRLTLELTESAIVADPDRAMRVMNSLKALDTTLAMDDFGTGYSNLASLQRLPIDILKIDRSFVTGMLADKDKVAIVRAVLSLAHALGMATTAEGIETIELSQTLAALGCSCGQGFYYAKPLDPDAALDFLLSSKS